MPTTYQKAKKDVVALVDAMAKKYHVDLVNAGVTIDILMAHNPDGDAVTLGGYPCQAKVKIVNLKDRAKGCKDAEIIIDEMNWNDLTPEQQKALVDHELEHLELNRDPDTNAVALDDLSRPKLKMLKHDWQIGWFNSIALRHKENSPECRQAKELVKEAGQIYFSFAAEPVE